MVRRCAAGHPLITILSLDFSPPHIEQTKKLIQDDYRSYLMRLWRVRLEEGSAWRASLEEVPTGELHGFPNLTALMSYLKGLDCTDRDDKTVREHFPE